MSNKHLEPRTVGFLFVGGLAVAGVIVGQAFGIASVAVALTAGLIAPPAQAMDAPTPAAPATTCTETWNPQGGTCRLPSTTGVNGTVYLILNADDCNCVPSSDVARMRNTDLRSRSEMFGHNGAKYA
jgi:hypothetical protein